MATPTARAPAGIFSPTREYRPRRSLSRVIMSPSDISCSMRLARMSAWFKATSTWKFLSKSQALRGLLMQAMVRGTLKRVRARKQRARLSASPARQAVRTWARSTPASSRVWASVALPS